MDCVKLYFKNYLVGVLTYLDEDSKYVFVKNKFFNNEEVNNITGLNSKDEFYYSSRLFPFFLILLRKYGCEGFTYQDLVKLAHVDFDKSQFWIEV